MKKIAMMTVKGAVGLLPKSVKARLKDNHKLTEFYSRSLQRSGLFYGFPSKKKRMALYGAYLKKQNQALKSFSGNDSASRTLFLVVLGKKQSEQTLSSAEKCGILSDRIFIVNAKSPASSKNEFSSICEAVADIPASSGVLIVNSGDTLVEEASDIFASSRADADIFYCDTDKFDKKGKRTSPHFLPDWNPDLLFSTAYVNTGVMFSAELIKGIASQESTIAGLMAKIAVHKKDTIIRHIPYTLVHRGKDSPKERALNEITCVLNETGKPVSVYDKELGINHVQWPVLSNPLVSLIIPTRNGKELVQACIESILQKTTYNNFEILLIDNGSDEQESIDYFKKLSQEPQIRVLSYPGEFNYSAINNFGVQHARGEVVGLINNDIEVIKPEWLTYMLGHALRDDVGCVGAKLLYSDGRVQHAGVVLGYGGGAGHAHKYFPRYHPGYLKRLIATQNYSAVTAACLLVKKSKFIEVGGLNEKDLTVAFNDVDFCLRVRETGVMNLYCAEAELYHHESVSRGLDLSPDKAARFKKELDYLQVQWCDYIQHDPAYSPNLTLKRENFSVKTKEEFSESGN